MNLFSRKSITDWVEEARRTDGLLIDVRTPEEYHAGHIPGSVNIPLGRTDTIKAIFPDPEARLYVYCRSGSRSAQACALFQQMGYKSVQNIGGILSWHGEIAAGESA